MRDPLVVLNSVDEYRAFCGLTADDFWLPASHVGHLVGWSRSRVYELRKSGVLAERDLDAGGVVVPRLVSGRDVVSVVRARL